MGYNKKNAEKEEVKTKEQRDISIKIALKKILKKKKLLNIQKQKKDKRIENAVKEEPTITTEEANKKEDESVDRECIMCIKSIPTCDPSCNKCAVKRSTCSTCSEAICLDVVEKEIDDLVTLDEILDKAIEEEEKEIEEKKKTEANKIASKIRANKIKARSLLRDVVGKTTKEKDAIQITVESVKERLVEEGGVPDADDEAINTPEKVWAFAAKIDEARKKTRAFLARSKEATNNADGGGRRRLSELEITHDKVEAALQKEGLTMAGSECDVD